MRRWRCLDKQRTWPDRRGRRVSRPGSLSVDGRLCCLLTAGLCAVERVRVDAGQLARLALVHGADSGVGEQPAASAAGTRRGIAPIGRARAVSRERRDRASGVQRIEGVHNCALLGWRRR